jgi:hypothetical protein
MLFRSKPALVLVLAALAGCSGGGGGGASLSFSCTGADATVICLESCNLGCSVTGCARTDIAQNEIILLTFSEPIDEGSVGPSSIRFRTASGEQPVGEFFVNGKTVEFVPTLAISGGQTFFGFAAGETYTMTIPGGGEQTSVVRGTSGKPFERTVTCTLQVTRGVQDLNGVPPRATMVVPTQSQLTAAPRDTAVVLEFNEMIDATPFLAGGLTPVTFGVRRTRPAAAGGTECDPFSAPQPLGGTQTLDFDAGRGISILTFRPVQQLPGNVCVEVNVTDGVTDLSGKPAQPQVFTFKTVVVPLVEASITENFDDDTFLDAEASAAQWGGGVATFLAIGGDGSHGAFTLAPPFATDTNTFVEGRRVWEVSTDLAVIPASQTTTGNPIPVSDGRFFFTTMVVPSDVRVRFVGSRPPQITVAGRLDVLGHIDVSGQSNTTMPANPTLPTQPQFQPGAAGGAGAGRGGNGGAKISIAQSGTGGAGANASNQGANGEDARMLAGHAYFSSTVGSGGRGSSVFPASGLNANLYYGGPTTTVVYTPSASAGGGGGGLLNQGGNGQVISNNHGTPPPLTSQMGPPAPGGSAVQLFPFPPSGGLQRASQHFLVGGSGGGGSASHAALALGLVASADKWVPGAGGGGGGGAIALRAGNSLRLGPASRVLAAGGSAANSPAGISAGAQTAPAGGGSGGSVVLQSGRIVDISGLIDVRGGNGGTFNRSSNPATPPNGATVQIAGGNGSPGFVRLEAPIQPPLSQLASMQPAATAQNVGTLGERDALVECTSRFYSTQLIFGPEYARYEIRGTIDGVPFVLSDDPAVATQEAREGAPVRALWQGARLDLSTSNVLEFGPWRTSVRSSSSQTGIASDGLNGFRFRLFADYTLGTAITVDSVIVVYRV